MDFIKANWKTSIVAVGLLIVTIGHAIQNGTVSMADVVAVLGALGFTAAADAKS